MKDKYDWYKAGGFPQGDVLIEIVESIPDDAVVIGSENGNNIIAHSETGHHHVIPADDSVQYAVNDDQFVSYVKVNNDTSVIHLRSHHTHETRHLKSGTILRIRKQTQETPEGILRVVD